MKESIERVNLPDRSYNIVIGSGVVGKEVGKRVKRLDGAVLIVSNRKVFGLYGDVLAESLCKAGVVWKKLLLPDGERYKKMAAVEKIHDRLVASRYDRNAIVVALGGGVIGDIAGFTAATYMRGIRIVQIPTTLLAQVDSSVGGKTGVNHPKGKNLIGAFYQPSLVVADSDTLKTLPREEILCGVAEVVKYGCIASAKFFRFLEGNIEKLVAVEPSVTRKAVKTSCRIKADIVAKDEKEAGIRATLNFGHTVGHAIEAVTGYKRYRHGHAVAIGMRTAAELSRIKGRLSQAEVDRISGILVVAGLPTVIPDDIGQKALMSAMKHDKKVSGGAMRFALLDKIGACDITSDVMNSEIKEAITRSRK